MIFHLAMFLHYHDLFILVFQKWKLDDIGFTRLWFTSFICEWHSYDINKIEELEHFRIICSGVNALYLYPAIPQFLVLSTLQSGLMNLNAENWTWTNSFLWWTCLSAAVDNLGLLVLRIFILSFKIQASSIEQELGTLN